MYRGDGDRIDRAGSRIIDRPSRSQDDRAHEAIGYAGSLASLIERDGIKDGSRAMDRIEDQHRGMRWIASIIPACDGSIERICDAVAYGYRIDGGMLRDRIIDRLAGWIGAMSDAERDARLSARCGDRIGIEDGGIVTIERIEGYAGCEHRSIERCQHARWMRWMHREARRIARRMPSGGGSMPSLAGTFERAEGSGRWMDEDGDDAPSIGIPHPYADDAPDVPERDAPSLASHRWMDALDHDEAMMMGAIMDAIERAPSSRIERDRVRWEDAIEAMGDTRHRSTIQRDARAIASRAIARARMRDEAPDDPASSDDRIASPPSRHECDERCGMDHASSVVQGYRGWDEAHAEDERKLRIAHRQWIEAMSDPAIIDDPYHPCDHGFERCDEGCAIEQHRAMSASRDRIASWMAEDAMIA
jgi:hypothetical protein